MNERFQKACKMEATPTPPIWMMRQAGRYHSHYQKLRKEHSFMDLCKKPQLAAEVAMGPVEDFDFDLAILFSDLLFPLEALGMPLEYAPGPKLGFSLSQESIGQLKMPVDPAGFFDFQKEALVQTRARLPQNKSLIGFVGGVWTLFAYAVEGSHKGGLPKSKASMALYRRFAEIMEPLLEINIQEQIDGGAEVVMLLDTAAGELSSDQFKSLVLPWLEKITNRFPNRLGYYTQNLDSSLALSAPIQESDLAGIGVDHHQDLASLLSDPRRGRFIQGNFDPLLMGQSGSLLEESIHQWLEPIKKLSAEQRRGWVCGLGHGLVPHIPEDSVRSFIKIVRESFGGLSA